VCAERAKAGEKSDGAPWGRIFFCVTVEKATEDEPEKVEVPLYHEVAELATSTEIEH
jgi:hypothetical protein